MDQFYHEYSTGSTRPKKDRKGLVTFLLICVIFLGGLVTALGLINIHLFHKLDAAKDAVAEVSFRQGEALPHGAFIEEMPACLELGGMKLLEVSTAYRNLYSLPIGLFVAQVFPGSQAHAFSIEAGDLLVAVNGTPVHSLDALRSALTPQSELTFVRRGQENTYLFSFKKD